MFNDGFKKSYLIMMCDVGVEFMLSAISFCILFFFFLIYSMCGPSTDADWLIEGRRLIPLMPRLVPQTAFTVTANQAVNLQVEKNAALPNPAQTGNKDCKFILSSFSFLFFFLYKHDLSIVLNKFSV